MNSGLPISCSNGAYQLGQDAADRPHVDFALVLAAAEQDFWRPVPQRDDFVRVAFHRDRVEARESEVRELHSSALVDENVLGFEVSVQHVEFVAEVEALEDLEDDALRERRVP